MPEDTKAKSDLKDLNAKLKHAQEAANAPEAGERDKADLKLLEQEVVAKKLKANRPEPAHEPATSVDAKLDKALKDSFPGSDPVSFLEAAPFKKSDHTLSPMKTEPVKTKE